MERITVDNIPLDFTGEGDYSGYTKLQVVIACGEGDVYLLDREMLGIYGNMGAFEPLDDLVTAEGVDTSGLYLTITSYSGNPEYARKALIWLCGQTQEEPPAWMNDLEELEDELGENADKLPEIG